MTNNPYQPPEPQRGPTAPRRPVRRYAILGIALLVIGVPTLIPGLVLLNQKTQLVPTNSFITSLDINGRPVSNQTVMWWSLLMGGLLLLIATALITRAIWNWRPKTQSLPPNF